MAIIGIFIAQFLWIGSAGASSHTSGPYTFLENVNWIVNTTTNGWDNGAYSGTNADNNKLIISQNYWGNPYWADESGYTNPYGNSTVNYENVSLYIDSNTDNLKFSMLCGAVGYSFGSQAVEMYILDVEHNYKVMDEYRNYPGTDSSSTVKYYNVSSYHGTTINFQYWATSFVAVSLHLQAYTAYREIFKYSNLTSGTWLGKVDWLTATVIPENITISSENNYAPGIENISFRVGWDTTGDGSVDNWGEWTTDNFGTHSYSLWGTGISGGGRVTAVEFSLSSDNTAHSPKVDNFSLWGYIATMAPDKPTNAFPAGQIPAENYHPYVNISAHVTHPDNLKMDVLFINWNIAPVFDPDNPTNGLIAENDNVSSGSTVWARFENGRAGVPISNSRGYEFYVVTRENTTSLYSEQSDVAVFWSWQCSAYTITVRNEEDYSMMDDNTVWENIKFSFTRMSDNNSVEVYAYENNPHTYYALADTTYVTMKWGDVISRRLLTHGASSITFLATTNDASWYNSSSPYAFTLNDQNGRWGVPNGELDVYKFGDNITWHVDDSYWNQDEINQLFLKYGDEYWVKCVANDGSVWNAGRQTVADVKTINVSPPPLQGLLENIENMPWAAQIAENILVNITHTGDNIHISYQDLENRTTWVKITIYDNNVTAVVDNYQENSGNFTYTFAGAGTTTMYAIWLEISHTRYGDWWAFRPYVINASSPTFPDVTPLIGTAPVAWLTVAGFFLIIVVLGTFGPSLAGVGAMFCGVTGFFLNWLGMSIPVELLFLWIILGIIAQAYIMRREGG